MSAPTTYRSAMRGVPYTLLSAQTALNTKAQVGVPDSFKNHTITITGSVGSPISAGAIQINSSDDPTFTGTWNPITAPITIVDSAKIQFNFIGLFRAIQVVISTALIGGTVTASYEGS